MTEPGKCIYARDLTVPAGVGVVAPGVGDRKPATEWRPFFALLVSVPTSCLPERMLVSVQYVQLWFSESYLPSQHARTFSRRSASRSCLSIISRTSSALSCRSLVS